MDDGLILLVVSYSSTSHLRLAMSPLIVPDHERGKLYMMGRFKKMVAWIDGVLCKIKEDGGMNEWGRYGGQVRWRHG